MKRKCPICQQLLHFESPDWTLQDQATNDHRVATVGTSNNAPANIASTVESQIASNLAAYDLDCDEELNLGFMGTAWIQCPEKRENITGICVPK